MLCVVVDCEAGMFREGTNPGKCVKCPRGTYRSAKMANCTSCGDPGHWRTEGSGKMSRADCRCKQTC